jgi:hypothetical protein
VGHNNPADLHSRGQPSRFASLMRTVPDPERLKRSIFLFFCRGFSAGATVLVLRLVSLRPLEVYTLAGSLPDSRHAIQSSLHSQRRRFQGFVVSLLRSPPLLLGTAEWLEHRGRQPTGQPVHDGSSYDLQCPARGKQLVAAVTIGDTGSSTTKTQSTTTTARLGAADDRIVAGRCRSLQTATIRPKRGPRGASSLEHCCC